MKIGPRIEVRTTEDIDGVKHLYDQIHQLQRAYTVLERAVNWVLVEMARDCAGGSIGDHWRMELDDARAIAREALRLNQHAAPGLGGES